MFQEKNLSLVAYAGNFSINYYKTEDEAKDIEAAGYFSAVSGQLKNAVIFVDYKDKSSIYKMMEKNSAVIDLLSALPQSVSVINSEVQLGIGDVLISDLPEKYDAETVSRNLRIMAGTINEVLDTLRVAGMIQKNE